MKSNVKWWILAEAILAVLVVLLAGGMLREKGEKKLARVSVIMQDSDGSRWAAFRYGVKMAAADCGLEAFVASADGTMAAEKLQEIIEEEISRGADAVIVQPMPGADMEEMLKRMEKRVPVMLAGGTVSLDREESLLPWTAPDNYAMGAVLAEELLRDYSGSLEGKSIGIFLEEEGLEAPESRERGLRDKLAGSGARISWRVCGSLPETGEGSLEEQPKVDFVLALDDGSMTTAGACAAANCLHGALVYGIGSSTEAAYYLDTGRAECLVMADEFNMGYQSLAEVADGLGHYLHKLENREISHRVIRRDALFSKENQEALFTMSQ